MSDEFDERQEVIERKEGYHWSIQVQLGKASERVKAKASGNEKGYDRIDVFLKEQLKSMPEKVKEAHEELTEEE